ncbi:hypothetical protein D1007_48949 [Hordeum vulgare]|nr:hypothetical protein D1007_48949 [Hordeum vulgare]
MPTSRQSRVERRIARVAQTVPMGHAGARWSPSPVVNAATGPGVQEQQGSSHPITEHPDGRTATPSLVQPSGSSSRARPREVCGQRALAMANELLPYRPVADWLQRIEEVIATAGEATVRSGSLRPQPSHANNEE